MKTKYHKNIRYKLYSENPGSTNWLCIPGGPGADSTYYSHMLDLVEFPGKVWLVDFPENGDNCDEPNGDYDFEQWFELFIPFIDKFDNPAIIGHSFGAMLPLYFPELEERLKAFIILNSTPTNWLVAAAKKREELALPELNSQLQEFRENPNQQSFKKALRACYPYYFSGDYNKKGDKVFADLPFNYHAAAWWQNKVNDQGFNAKWVPQSVPTIIVGGAQDYITPIEVYQNDKRFQHIHIEEIEDAGHMPWIDQPEKFKSIIKSFLLSL